MASESDNSDDDAVQVDESIIDAMLALTPEERLRQNDRMIRTIELLRQGLTQQSGENGR